MKLDSAARKTLLQIAVGVIAFCAVMTGVYFAIGKWTVAVLLGTILGGGYAIFNLYLQARSVQKAMNSGDLAGRVLRSSYSLRMLGIVAMLVVAAVIPQIDVLAACIPLLFPRFTIFVMQITGQYRPNEIPEEKEESSK